MTIVKLYAMKGLGKPLRLKHVIVQGVKSKQQAYEVTGHLFSPKELQGATISYTRLDRH